MRMNQLWWASFGTESKPLGVVILRASSFTAAILAATETLAQAIDVDAESAGEKVACSPYPVIERAMVDLRITEKELPCYRSPQQIEEAMPHLKPGLSEHGMDVSDLDSIRDAHELIEGVKQMLSDTVPHSAKVVN